MTTESPRKFDPSDRRRPRHLSDAKSEEITFPLAWLIIGGLAALIVIGLLGLGVVNIFRQQSITPTPEVLPPLVEPIDVPAAESGAVDAAQPPVAEEVPVNTPIAAESPAQDSASPAVPEAPAQITVNGYVKVVGTGGAGLSMRAGPGRNNARVLVAEEDDETVLLVLEGPREDENGEDFVWWYVRHPEGTEGWVVEDFIVPTTGP